MKKKNFWECDFNNLPLGYMEKSSCPLSSVAQRGLGGIRTIYGWPFRGKGRAGRHQSQGLFHQWIQGEDTPFSTLVVVQPFYTVGNIGFYRNDRVPYVILVCGTIGFQVDSSATTEFTVYMYVYIYIYIVFSEDSQSLPYCFIQQKLHESVWHIWERSTSKGTKF